MSGLRIGRVVAIPVLSTWMVISCATDSKNTAGSDGGPMNGGASSTGGSGGGTSSAGGSGSTTQDGSTTGGKPSGTGGTTAGPDAGSGGATSPGTLLGTFQLTYYWVTAETDFMGTNDTQLFDSACNVLATVTSAFADSVTLEGTGRLSDGRLINLDGACACLRSPCFAVLGAQFPWGAGAQSNALVPFRSIAVDKSVIPLGTHIYVEELDGVTMPGDSTYGQFVHDGCVSADDVGGGIIGQHIDFFAALETNYVALDTVVPAQVTLHAGGTRCP